jgi:hypothetical protein
MGDDEEVCRICVQIQRRWRAQRERRCLIKLSVRNRI